ncbi:MAG: hypothetical protein NTX96_01565 [Candidatus Zambryskibacteria bacterium]|nr:hypothetical protein [Candidatus Zambryskibacteria bacterium]
MKKRNNVYKYAIWVIYYDIITPMKQLVFILFFMCILGFFGIANAQLGSLPQTEINVEMIPEAPGPNEVVYVSVVSYATNINAANITWKINDKTLKSGVGEKSFSFTTGAMNTVTTLDIVVETQEGEVIEKTFSIRPASIDLVWESVGFVPPFYKGKSLFSHQNQLTIIALPHIISASGTEIGAKNLIYTWKKNGSVVDGVSGFGKNTYSFISSLISRPINIEVEVATPDGSGSGYATLALTPAEPSVLFYRKDPIYGIEFQKSLYNTIGLKNSKEIVVVGIPLFFGITNSNAGELVYKWSINGSPVNNSPEQSTQVFRQNEGTSGTSNISLSIENTKKILQYASSNFNLMFGE